MNRRMSVLKRFRGGKRFGEKGNEAVDLNEM